MQCLAGADHPPSFEDLLPQETDDVAQPTGQCDPTIVSYHTHPEEVGHD